jgi:uncharacterized repeat protein (TIGR03803 family)
VGVDSKLLGACLLGCAAIALAQPAAAGPAKPGKVLSDQLLYSFAGGPSDGAFPVSGLIADNAGNFYGATEYGGANNLGAVYELAPNGTETVLYNFAGGASDGALPAASLIMDGAGNLYGTTVNGGDGDCADSGCGTVFEVTPGGGETVLYSFQGDADGVGPQANLFMDSAGNLYGTTYAGGSPNCEGGCGTVFELTPSGNSWTESVLYTFAGGADGAGPLAGLIEDNSGNLYGTTASGGPSIHCPGGCGTVFELSPSGGSWTENVIYFFKPPHHNGDGAYPQSNLLLDSNGNLWGTTPEGGPKICGGGCGAVFELTPSHGVKWDENQFIRFQGARHGAFPSGGLISDGSGTFYGVTAGAGGDNCGVIYQLNGAKAKPLYSFTGEPSDACQAYGALTMDKNGNLYGTSLYGGSANMGAIFKLKN